LGRKKIRTEKLVIKEGLIIVDLELHLSELGIWFAIPSIQVTDNAIIPYASLHVHR
jgi:hypothetical protein